MINFGKKMIFATGTRERGAQFTVTKRPAERGDSTDDPEHQQSKARLDVGNLKSETGEHAGADNVGDDNSAGGKKADRAPGSSRIRRRLVHVGIDNGIGVRD